MKSRILSFVAGLCSVWLVAPASLAEPFVFIFDMPAFTGDVLSGTTSTLTITVDNGGSSILSQSWASDQFIEMSTDISGPASSLELQNGVQTGAIETNSAGVPTLSFGPINYYVFGQEGNGDRLIQVGRDCDYGVGQPGGGGDLKGTAGCLDEPSIWPITGRAAGEPTTPRPSATAVPTMSAYGLVLTTVGLLVVGWRRLRSR